jgi:hypothetical protein
MNRICTQNVCFDHFFLQQGHVAFEFSLTQWSLSLRVFHLSSQNTEFLENGESLYYRIIISFMATASMDRK